MSQTVARHLVDALAPADVEPGIRAALARNGPVLVGAAVAAKELPVPPAIDLEMAGSFTLYMVRAVTDGRDGELIDLARTHLWR